MSTPTKSKTSRPSSGNLSINSLTTLTTSPPSRSTFTLIQTSTPLSAISNTNTTTSPTQTQPQLTLLIHATNTFGTWGAGFALALHNLYPAASKVYKAWCDEHRPSPTEWPCRELVGRCLVVPPQDGDGGDGSGEVWIGCLFTSYGYGGRDVHGGKAGGHARKDAVETVKRSTMGALRELRGWIREVERGVIEGESGDSQKKEKSKVVIYSPKFNSGNFGVDWEVTAGMIREVFGDWDGEWRILADP